MNPSNYRKMKATLLAMLIGISVHGNQVHGRPPELKSEIEEGGRRVIRWDMGEAAFVDLQRAVESSDQWETVLSSTTLTSFTCATGESSKTAYRLVHPLGWRITVVDTNTIVGRYNSLAYSHQGRPCISYESDSPSGLKFAEYDGVKWRVMAIDTCKTGATSLAFDSKGNPAIAYNDTANWDLKYAVRNVQGWSIVTVDQADMVGMHASLAFSPTGDPAISYLDGTHGSLKYTERKAGKWHATTVDSESFVGEFNSLKFSPSGTPSISYRSEFQQALKYAAYDGEKWTLSTVDKNHTGWYSSLAFDPKGAARIAYWDQQNKNPKVAVSDGSQWRITPVDSSGVSGRSTSLAITRDGRSALAFSDDTDLLAPKLRYAFQNGSTWTHSLVDENIGGGYQISLVFNASGLPSISYYDLSERRLKFAELIPITK